MFINDFTESRIRQLPRCDGAERTAFFNVLLNFSTTFKRLRNVKFDGKIILQAFSVKANF